MLIIALYRVETNRTQDLEMKKLTFDNGWMTLHAVSMGRLFQIAHIAPKGEGDFVAVSQLGEDPSACLISEAYTGKLCSFESLNTDEKAFDKQILIKSDGKYLQVAFASDDHAAVHKMMSERDDVGLIATDNDGRMYLASNEQVTVDLKKAG